MVSLNSINAEGFPAVLMLDSGCERQRKFESTTRSIIVLYVNSRGSHTFSKTIFHTLSSFF